MTILFFIFVIEYLEINKKPLSTSHNINIVCQNKIILYINTTQYYFYYY